MTIDRKLIETIKARLSYDPDTGLVRYRMRRGCMGAGKIAGHVWRDSIRVEIDRQSMSITKVIWALQTGAFPRGEVDHINRDWTDNRWINLRDATHKQNSANAIHRRLRALPKGIHRSPNGKKFCARLHRDGLGTFTTLREARIVHGLAMLESFGDFACFDDRYLGVLQ